MKSNLIKIFCFLYFLFSFLIIFGEEDNPDKKLFEQKCSLCHTIERPLSKKKTSEDWRTTVETMRKKNTKHINEDEAIIIANYLISTRGQPEINKVKDPNNLTELEMKHAPVVTITWDNPEKGEVTISVEVGKTHHPMGKDHYIKFIEIFIDHNSIIKKILTPEDKPVMEFKTKIAEGASITALIECNKHGLWEGGIR